MSLIVQLAPEIEERVRREAAIRGVETSELIAEMVASHLPPVGHHTAPLSKSLSPDEWKRLTHPWARRDITGLPQLPEEALTRDGIYGDHP